MQVDIARDPHWHMSGKNGLQARDVCYRCQWRCVTENPSPYVDCWVKIMIPVMSGSSTSTNLQDTCASGLSVTVHDAEHGLLTIVSAPSCGINNSL